jgi:peptidoglycan hydrolase-like protein with peptidoglycan-binding domain
MSLRSIKTGFVFMVAMILATGPSFASRTHRGPTSGHLKSSSGKKARASRIRGQREIDSTRATQIQQALIKQKYLSGSPSGQWDQQTAAAMQRFQADHGWQTKLMPDSRALIKLGLGPSAPATSDHGAQSSLVSPGLTAPDPERGGSASNGGRAMLGSNSLSQLQ